MQTTTFANPAAPVYGPEVGPSAPSMPARGFSWRTWLAVGAAIAVGIPIVWTGAATQVPMAADLSRLLRMMAVLKATIAVVTLGVVWWRFAFPTAARFAFPYVTGSWLMAAGSVVMWQLTHLIFGAAAFHLGLALILVTAWRDTSNKPLQVRAS